VFEGTPVNDQFHLVVENIRRGFGEVLAIGIASPAHDVPIQNRPLRGIRHVFDGCAERAKGQSDIVVWQATLNVSHIRLRFG